MPELRLLLGQEIAGTVSRTTTGTLTFSYDPDYLARHQLATPVSVSMPPQVVSHTDNRIRRQLADRNPSSPAPP